VTKSEFKLETLLQSFSLALSQAEQRIEAALGTPSLSMASISLDVELVKRPNELYGFAPSDGLNVMKFKIFKLAGQDAELFDGRE